MTPRFIFIDLLLAVLSGASEPAAQVVDDLDGMEKKIREARTRHADLIVFPARAAPESALPRLQAAAREHHITVVFGAGHRVDGPSSPSLPPPPARKFPTQPRPFVGKEISQPHV